MQIIALVGAKGSGKTTVSRLLVERRGFVRMRFADPLKRMLRAMGLTDTQIDGDLKEVETPLLGGKTPRWAMQSLGTDWGRRLMTDDLWVNVMRTDILASACRSPGVKIVIDDMRFPNEDLLMRELGATKWRVRRREVEPDLTKVDLWLAQRGWHPMLHASEAHWPRIQVDAEIDNNGSLDQLTRTVVRMQPAIPVLTL